MVMIGTCESRPRITSDTVMRRLCIASMKYWRSAIGGVAESRGGKISCTMPARSASKSVMKPG